MAVTELIIPQVKSDAATQEEFKKQWPTLSKTFEDYPAVTSGFYGWVNSENGTDVEDKSKFVLLLGTSGTFSYSTQITLALHRALPQFLHYPYFVLMKKHRMGQNGLLRRLPLIQGTRRLRRPDNTVPRQARQPGGLHHRPEPGRLRIKTGDGNLPGQGWFCRHRGCGEGLGRTRGSGGQACRA